MLKSKTKQELIDLGLQLYLENARLKQELREYKHKNKLWFFKGYYHWLKNEQVFHSIAFLKVDMELLDRFGRGVLEVKSKTVTWDFEKPKNDKKVKSDKKAK